MKKEKEESKFEQLQREMNVGSKERNKGRNQIDVQHSDCWKSFELMKN